MNSPTAEPTLPKEPVVHPRRLRGAYYTPTDLADVLTEWALASGRGTVLDPSFGQCAFLDAAVRVLTRKGVPQPGRLVFGVDVDRSALEYALGSENFFQENCVIADFLTLSPKNLRGAPFQAIVGNPPYVRHHWFNGPTKQAGRKAVDAAGVKLPATASAWAYFLIHALSFIREQGRLAMLVPEAIQQADYAQSVRNALIDRFERVCLVHIRDRMFDRTDEAVVVIAASGYGKSGSLQVEAVERTQDLAAVLNDASSRRSAPHMTAIQGRLVDSKVVQLLNELEENASVKKFSEIATLRIGMVTGANRHFIRNIADVEKLDVPRDAWLHVLARTRWLSGLEFTEEDLQERADAGRPIVLVRVTPENQETPGIRQWIADGVDAAVDRRFKCTIRHPWFCIPLPPLPEAFATCTRMGAPLLVVNGADCRCTNALHAVYWRKGGFFPRAAAVGCLTSAVSTWAELYGRRYGGGVLKMEPGTWNQMPIPMPEGTEDAFDELNQTMRRGQEVEARTLADELVLRERLGLPRADIRRLQHAQAELMSQRRPARAGSDHG